MKLDEFLKGSVVETEILILLDELTAINDLFERMVNNLRVESILERGEWNTLLSGILGFKTDINTLSEFIINFSRGKILHGKKVDLDPDIVFGRVVSLDNFCEMLVLRKYYTSPLSAKADIRSRLGLSPNLWGDYRRSQKLGRFLMWATFETDKSAPFLKISHIEEILCSLGIDINPGPYLLFEYQLPTDVIPLTPTFFDSYSNSSWNKYFHRVDETAPFGMTEPTGALKGFSPRPEVVHNIIRGYTLVAPLRFG